MFFGPGNAKAKYTASMIKLHRSTGTAKRPKKRLPGQRVPKMVEYEYARAINSIVDEIFEALRPLNERLSQLAESARAERYDAGEADTVAALIEQARKELAGKITPERVESLARAFANRTATSNAFQLRRQIQAALGVNLYVPDTRIGALMDGFIAENVTLIKGMPNKILDDIAVTIQRGLQRGFKAPELSKELTKRYQMSKKRAKLIARDQIGTFYGQVNANRQKDIGVTRFVWRTVGDDRVRDSHEARDGNIYSYDDPPDGELPSEPINCRCWAEPVFSDILEA